MHNVVDHHALHGLVNLKTATEPDEEVRLRREAAVLEAAGIPGLVELIDHRDEGGRVEVRTRHVGTRSVLTLGGGSPATLAALGAGVAATLADLHRRGLSHGAVQADHVLVGAQGQPVLCSLGRAGAEEAVWAGHLPPAEDGRTFAPADDVAALGVLLADLAGRDTGWRTALGRRRLLGVAAGANVGRRLAATDGRPAGRHPRRPQRGAAHPGPRHRRDRGRGGRSPRPAHPVLRSRARSGHGDQGCRAARADASPCWWRPPSWPGRPPPPSSPASAPRPARTPPPRRRSGRRPRSPPVTEPVADADAPPEATTDVSAPATTAASVATTTPASCPDSYEAAARDGVDAGCADRVAVVGRQVSLGPLSWDVGQDGDELAVADVDCDGRLEVALLRPSTAELFAFATWAPPGQPVTVTARAVPGALALVTDAGTCGLSVQQPDGLPVAVDLSDLG